MSEKTIAVIRPSQILNLPHYIVWSAIALVLFVGDEYLYNVPLFLLPIPIVMWRYLVVHCVRYEITTERIRWKRGVLNRKLDETELYRVRDYSIRRPFYLLIFRLSTLRIDTQDVRQNVISMTGIHNAEDVLSVLREQVEASRARKNVRDLDIGVLR